MPTMSFGLLTTNTTWYFMYFDEVFQVIGAKKLNGSLREAREA